jgi:hypothetical protein
MKDDIVQAALERLYQMQCDMLSDIETVASALEQPKQVDVLAEYTGDGTHRQWVSTGAWLMPGERVLHTGADHPPRREWRSLSVEEIRQIALDMPIDGTNFARAIEAALKERNA